MLDRRSVQWLFRHLHQPVLHTSLHPPVLFFRNIFALLEAMWAMPGGSLIVPPRSAIVSHYFRCMCTALFRHQRQQKPVQLHPFIQTAKQTPTQPCSFPKLKTHINQPAQPCRTALPTPPPQQSRPSSLPPEAARKPKAPPNSIRRRQKQQDPHQKKETRPPPVSACPA